MTFLWTIFFFQHEICALTVVHFFVKMYKRMRHGVIYNGSLWQAAGSRSKTGTREGEKEMKFSERVREGVRVKRGPNEIVINDAVEG